MIVRPEYIFLVYSNMSNIGMWQKRSSGSMAEHWSSKPKAAGSSPVLTMILSFQTFWYSHFPIYIHQLLYTPIMIPALVSLWLHLLLGEDYFLFLCTYYVHVTFSIITLFLSTFKKRMKERVYSSLILPYSYCSQQVGLQINELIYYEVIQIAIKRQ